MRRRPPRVWPASIAIVCGLSGLGLLLGCSSTSEHGEPTTVAPADSAPEAPSGAGVETSRDLLSSCLQESGDLGATERTYCSAGLAGGYELLFLGAASAEHDSSGESGVVVVDPGGPILRKNEVLELLVGLADDVDESAAMLALVPPEPEMLSAECREAIVEEIAAACDLNRIAHRYVAEYEIALNEALEVVGDDSGGYYVDLLGGSYASARWSQITAEGRPPQLRNAVIVSPLPIGITGSSLESSVIEVTEALFDSLLSADCSDADCLMAMDLNVGPACAGGACRPQEDIAAEIGEAPIEVLEGLIGLAPFAVENASMLRSALDDGDVEDVRKLLEQGRASYVGLDPLGDRSIDEVHSLAGVCAVLDVEDLGERYAGCAGAERSGLVVGEAVHDALSGPESARRACFLVTYPDPLLGDAGMQGDYFGQSAGRSLVPGYFGHGDLELGAVVLSRMKDFNDAQLDCSVPGPVTVQS